MTAREIARDFISTMNPSGWDGVGQKPDDLNDKQQITYHVGKYPDIDVDIHYEYDDNRWWHVCEAYDKELNERLCGGAWGDTVNNIDDMIRTIKYLFDMLGIKL